MTQTALPLEPTQSLPLREAYDRTRSIRNKYTFEQAMSRPVLALTLRLYAEAILRERQQA